MVKGPLARIKQATARAHGMPMSELLGDHRLRPTVRARQVAMWVARQITAATTSEIAKAFGFKDHTTVTHAVAMINHLIEIDQEIVDVIQEIDALLYGGARTGTPAPVAGCTATSPVPVFSEGTPNERFCNGSYA